jgi:signal transduction histidine kinase
MTETTQPLPETEPARRVLIVDDDHDLAESLADILVPRGYQVDIANSIRQVREICEDFNPQVALLDIRLGRDSGLDVIGILKQRNPDVICVMVTAYAEMETAVEALRLGAQDYLSKPLDPHKVLAILERCFDKVRLKKDARAAFETLLKAKCAAESADQSKTEFLASMSHELRTPLHSIIGFSEVLMSQAFGELGNEKYVDYAGNIRESGMHLLDIINDILDIAKAEAGKLELREDPFDVPGIIDSALRLIGPQAETAAVEIETGIEADLPALHGDEQKVRQVLINLLSNAVKFTPKGGKIEITASRGRNGEIVITVQDTGIGIAPEDIPRALAPFAQVDSELSRGHPGTGLGLSLSAAMVELHGGSLTLESEPGQGTTVSVRFPAERSMTHTDAA